MQEKYHEKIVSYDLQKQKYEKYHKQLGIAKLITAVALLFMIYLTSKNWDFTSFVLTVVLGELLILLWIIHFKTEDKLNFYLGMGRIYQEYIDRINGNWINFKDWGDEFVDLNHDYSHDLDIVGKKSLFQRINTSKTSYGRNIFAKALLDIQLDKETIEDKQDAVKELSGDMKFLTEFQYYGDQVKAIKDIQSLIAFFKEGGEKQVPVFIRVLVTCLPVISLACILVGAILKISPLYRMGIMVVLVQGVLWAAGSLKTAGYLRNISEARYRLGGYTTLFTMLEKQLYQSQKLLSIQEDLEIDGVKASEMMMELNKIIELIHLRNNIFLFVALNLFLLWDYRCMEKLRSWCDRYGAGIETCFMALGEYESLLCFTNIDLIEENTKMPTISPDTRIRAVNLGHPLIPKDQRVNNSFVLENEIFIISGSNMSGKTTFLRTIGMNLVLALNGASIVGDDLTAPMVKICSSMRISDDLSEGVSTFYAELRRIKQIIDLSKEDEPIMFLIDEIFKGTNSIDRISGARTVIETLEKEKSIGLITTHDLELCELGGEGRIKNYSFSEYYENNTIKFDYRLKEGKSTTTNAKFLMEMIGIVQGV